MERLTYRAQDGRARLTEYGARIYCSTQATADALCKYEEMLGAEKPEERSGGYSCRDCKAAVLPGDRYCHECGKPLCWYKGQLF